jgi:hypothetical protein
MDAAGVVGRSRFPLRAVGRKLGKQRRNTAPATLSFNQRVEAVPPGTLCMFSPYRPGVGPVGTPTGSVGNDALSNGKAALDREGAANSRRDGSQKQIAKSRE